MYPCMTLGNRPRTIWICPDPFFHCLPARFVDKFCRLNSGSLLYGARFSYWRFCSGVAQR